LDFLLTVFGVQTFAHTGSHDECVDDGDRKESPEHDYGDELSRQRGEEGRDDDGEHNGNQEFAKVPARINVVSNPLLLGSLVAQREKPLLTVGETQAGPFPFFAETGPSFFAVVGYQRALELCLAILATRGGVPLTVDLGVITR
jgi:hypothetical protein